MRGGDVDLARRHWSLELKSRPPVGLYNLETATGTGTLPAQVFRHGDRQFLGVILPRVGARRSERYTMKPQPAGAADLANRISIHADGATLAIELDRELVAAYRADTGNKPFFFPLIGPTGESYTRAFPMLRVADEDTDHPHQRSCWFTHGNVNGIDFWSEGKRTGTIHESGRTIVAGGTRRGTPRDARRVAGPRSSAGFARTCARSPSIARPRRA